MKRHRFDSVEEPLSPDHLLAAAALFSGTSGVIRLRGKLWIQNAAA